MKHSMKHLKDLFCTDCSVDSIQNIDLCPCPYWGNLKALDSGQNHLLLKSIHGLNALRVTIHDQYCNSNMSSVSRVSLKGNQDQNASAVPSYESMSKV